jgi:hypothetical protein
MNTKTIGIVVIATNSYFILGLRFVKKFLHHYSGDYKIRFYFFSDEDPTRYLASGADVVFKQTSHSSWVDATNSKFSNIISLESEQLDYLYYFDADTNVNKGFTEEWFLGDLVGGEHYGNRGWMKDRKGFDRNPASKAYVPEDTQLPQMYYYGAFFGGLKDLVIGFCKTLRSNQLEDKKIPYEPGVNDESYINQYFHFNPPTLAVPSDKFEFAISDKGGLGETRNPSLDISEKKKELLANPEKLFNIQNNQIILYA